MDNCSYIKAIRDGKENALNDFYKFMAMIYIQIFKKKMKMPEGKVISYTFRECKFIC